MTGGHNEYHPTMRGIPNAKKHLHHYVITNCNLMNCYLQDVPKLETKDPCSSIFMVSRRLKFCSTKTLQVFKKMQKIRNNGHLTPFCL